METKFTYERSPFSEMSPFQVFKGHELVLGCWDENVAAKVTRMLNNELETLQVMADIQSAAIGELAMGYKIDACSIGQAISKITGMTHPELIEHIERARARGEQA